MEQPKILGKSEHVGEIFLVMRERLQEVYFFFFNHFGALLLATLPFAAASVLVVHGMGEPLVVVEEKMQIHWPSALLLILLHPFALGVKIIAIHQLADSNRLTWGALINDALRLWPTLFGISLITGVGVFAGLFVFIIPAIWLYARLGYAPILAVTEHLGMPQALQAAWARSRPQQFELFIITLIFGLIMMAGMLLLFHLLANGATKTSIAADLIVSGFNEILLCLLTLIFYRFWSLNARTTNSA